jgi:hypothetical protein
LRVSQLSLADDPAYTLFLDAPGSAGPSVLGYHYPFFRDMLVRIGVGDPCFLAARSGERIVGVLPGFTRTSSAGTAYCSLPFFGPNAGVLCEPGPLAGEIHTALLGAAIEHVRALPGPISASFYTPFRFEDFDLYESALPDEHRVVPKFTQFMHPDRADSFYDIYVRSCRVLGIPTKPRETLDAMLAAAKTGDHVGVSLALLDGEVIAGCTVLYGPATASAFMLATREGARALQPATLLLDRALREAARRGMSAWNWESSPRRSGGVYQFKEKWGALEGAYRIYVVPFRPFEEFLSLGPEAIARHWPSFFVYPFSLLE